MKQLGMLARGENFIYQGKKYKAGNLIKPDYELVCCQSLEDGKNYKLSVETMVEEASNDGSAVN